MAEAALPELATVPWRARSDARWLRRWGFLWTLQTAVFVVPFVVAGGLLLALEPLAIPVALLCLVHAWFIPEVQAFRGARELLPAPLRNERAEPVAQGLLGDLLDHGPRELHRRTGLVAERGGMGVWLLGERGAALVTPGGRRVHCFCVAAQGDDLPPSDRVAHLLLALRSDEEGFATVANHSFSGAAWRLGRRLRPAQRPALAAAREAAGR